MNRGLILNNNHIEESYEFKLIVLIFIHSFQPLEDDVLLLGNEWFGYHNPPNGGKQLKFTQLVFLQWGT